MRDYSDIINLSRPIHNDDAFMRKHPPMSIENRAKIFAPFAALKRYDEAIKEASKVDEPDRELNEEELKELDFKLNYLKHLKDEKQAVMLEVIHFKLDNDSGEASYIKTVGMLSRLDMSAKLIQIVNEKIAFSNIMTIKSDVFDKI
ncbi:MAG: hypothetical protein K5656_07115 [Lachnospiraceae bacterium]|nr:hypothetical protein [Lachnospiraceae bacterium]